MKKHPILSAIAALAMVAIAVVVLWWSLGYRADNCHDPDMGRWQQYKCDLVDGRR